MRFFGLRIEAPVAPIEPTTSTIGLRVSWTCAGCKAVATTHQIVALARDGSMRGLDLPLNWANFDGQIACPGCGPAAAS